MQQNFGRTLNPWRLFDEMMNRATSDFSLGSPGSNSFPIDVIERDDHLIVRMDVAGAAPDSIDARLEGNVLTIIANLQDPEGENARYLWRERPTGMVRRAVTLPVRLDPDGTDASFQNGVLTVTLRKAPEATARRISIGGGSNPRAISG
ncbi:MAG TPA: Hsp20/alpha crystallin family protein [Deinococcales bacterium]|nr:Hsp20/alpha crystallin family protein [Deinococcales bacterium]